MKKVYIISRYRADTQAERDYNIIIAQHFAKILVLEGKKPVVPHLFYTQFLNDQDEEERRIGLDLAMQDLLECDEFLIITVDGIISSGMADEIATVARQAMHGKMVELTREEADTIVRVLS